MTVLRTDPEFANLAYEDAITEDLVVHIQRTYISDTNEQPVRLLHCSSVFYNEAEVPEHAWLAVVHRLNKRRSELQARMAEFEFRKRPDEPKSEEDRKVQSTQSSANSSKATRRPRPKASRTGT